MSVEERDLGWSKIMAEITSRDPEHVDVGIQSDEDGEVLEIAAAHEFGATINHPGGTPYGYDTEEDADAGRVRFLKKGSGFMVIGETEAHEIELPERSFIRGTIDQHEKEITEFGGKLALAILSGKMGKRQMLEIWGDKVKTKIRNGITTRSLGLTPNTPATIARKGSDTPLVDTGHLLGSITHKVK
jgi:hypothetical protein